MFDDHLLLPRLKIISTQVTVNLATRQVTQPIQLSGRIYYALTHYNIVVIITIMLVKWGNQMDNLILKQLHHYERR